MKKPALAIANDIHLQQDNIDQVKDLIKQIISYCLNSNINRCCLAGDVVDSRSSLRMDVLQALLWIEKEFGDHDIELDVFAGNHDKTRYDSEHSWMDVMGSSGAKVHKDYGIIYPDNTNMSIYMQPFFQDDILIKKLQHLNDIRNDEEVNILISHFGMEGSIDNEGGHVKSLITKEMLLDWDKVLLGHIHDETQVCANTYHMQALAQKDFGENCNKGFTVLYDNASHEIVNTKFKRFENVKIDLDTLSPAKVKKMIIGYENSENHIKTKIVGAENKVRAFDKKFIEDLGIKCEKIYPDVAVDSQDVNIENVGLKTSKNKLDNDFKEYCNKNELDYSQGVKYMEG